MAAWFGPETPILSYGPRAHANPGPYNDRVWILWPAWAFRVIAPAFRRGSFNALQKAVLGVLRASRLTAAELGERLGIHPELAAFVVTELQIQGRIDDNWAVTGRGIEQFDKERVESMELVPGWVFKDPWNDHLWPRVAPSFEYASTGQDENGRVVLELGTTGKPWQQRVWMQFPPDGQQPPSPDAHHILRAVRRHEQLERRRQVVDSQNDEDGIDIGGVAGLDIDRLASIEPVPEPVFLVSFLYIPRNGDNIDWYACEFFGRESDPMLRRLVDRVAEKTQGLAQQLDRLFGLTTHDNFAEFKLREKERDLRARRLLERTLTSDIGHREDIANALAGMIKEWLALHELGEMVDPQHRRCFVLISCRVILEQLFGEVARDWPLTGVSDRFSRSKSMNKAVLRNAASEIGLSVLPKTLRDVGYNHLHAVSSYPNNWQLRPLVVATLLRAQTEPDHCLRSAAKKAPDLLGRVESVRDLGNKAAHAHTDKFDSDDVDMSVQKTLDITGLLLNLPVRPIKEILQDGEKQK